MIRRFNSIFLVTICALLSFNSFSIAKDEWTEPFAGVRYLHRITEQPKWEIHLVFIDLTESTNRLVVTTQDDRGMTTNKWAKKTGVQVAVNGGMGGTWDGYAEPSGLTMGEGKIWTDVKHKGAHDRYGSFAEGDGRIAFYDPKILAKPEPWMKNILIGTAVMLSDGKPNPDMTDLDRMNPSHPRTAIAATKDLKTLMVLQVDGRQKHSVGMNAKEMQKLFMEFDAWTALNLDGGGSSLMFMQGQGTLNKPSDGSPRPVSTHLGLYASKEKSSPKGAIKGFVKDKATGKPLVGVKVAVSAKYFDSTDSDGFFALSEVPLETAALNVTLDGYKSTSVKPSVKKDAISEMTIELMHE